MNTTPEAWEEKFEKIMRNGRSRGYLSGVPLTTLKAFIRQSRSEARIEAWERARHIPNHLGWDGWLDRLIAEERSKQETKRQTHETRKASSLP